MIWPNVKTAAKLFIFFSKALCVWRCTTRKNLNKGVTWSISLNLWFICIYASKTKSICEPFFDWIKITDFFIVNWLFFGVIFHSQKMINFAIKKSVILIQSKKGCLNDFGFLYFAIQKHLWTWFHINLARFAPYAPLPIRAISVKDQFMISLLVFDWILSVFFYHK